MFLKFGLNYGECVLHFYNKVAFYEGLALVISIRSIKVSFFFAVIELPTSLIQLSKNPSYDRTSPSQHPHTLHHELSDQCIQAYSKLVKISHQYYLLPLSQSTIRDGANTVPFVCTIRREDISVVVFPSSQLQEFFIKNFSYPFCFHYISVASNFNHLIFPLLL